MTDTPLDAEDIFVEVFDLAPQDQLAQLDALCGDNVELRAEVDQLLSHHHRPASLLGALPQAVRDLASTEPDRTDPSPQPTAPPRANTPRRLVAIAGLGVLVTGIAFAVTSTLDSQRTTHGANAAWTAAVRSAETDPAVSQTHLLSIPPTHRDRAWDQLSLRLDPVVARYDIGRPSEGAVAFTPQGTPWFAFSRGARITVVDVTSGSTVMEVTADSALHRPAFSPTGALLAAWQQTPGDSNADLMVWNTATKARLTVHPTLLRHLTPLVVDDLTRTVTFRNGRVHVLHLGSRHIQILAGGVNDRLPVISPASHSLWIGPTEYDLNPNAALHKRRTLHGSHWGMTSPAGRWQLTGFADRAMWLSPSQDPASGFPLQGHRIAPHALAFSGDERVLVTGSADGTVCAWRCDGSGVDVLARRASSVAVDRSGRSILATTAEGAVLLNLDHRPSAR